MSWYRKAQTVAEVDAVARSKGYSGPFWHGTNEVNYVARGNTIPGDPMAKRRLAELKQIARAEAEKRHPDYDWSDIPDDNVGSLLHRFHMDNLSAEARKAYRESRDTLPKHTYEPSFNMFEYGEFGFHFGDEDAAEMKGETFPFYLKMDKSIRMPDLGTWNWQSVFREARKRGVNISEEEYTEVFNSRDEERAARELLIAKGIEVIVYKNDVEGFADSFMILVPQNIKLGLPVTYDDDGNPIPLSKRFDSNIMDFRY